MNLNKKCLADRDIAKKAGETTQEWFERINIGEDTVLKYQFKNGSYIYKFKGFNNLPENTGHWDNRFYYYEANHTNSITHWNDWESGNWIIVEHKLFRQEIPELSGLGSILTIGSNRYFVPQDKIEWVNKMLKSSKENLLVEIFSSLQAI